MHVFTVTFDSFSASLVLLTSNVMIKLIMENLQMQHTLSWDLLPRETFQIASICLWPCDSGKVLIIVNFAGEVSFLCLR